MNINYADLKLFVIFEAIYTNGGVSTAAKHLSLSQPAVSHALKKLRDVVNDPLFIRQGQTLSPTPKAEAIIDQVRTALSLFEDSLGQPNPFNAYESTRQYTLGMRSLMESSYFLPILSIIAETAPKVTLSSAPLDRARMTRQLATGAVNAVIDVFQPIQQDVHRKLIASSKTVVVARRGHSNLDGQISLEDYLASDHVCVTSRPQGHGPEDVFLARLGHHRKITTRCQQINTAMRIVSSSNKILTLPQTFAERANIWFDHQILEVPFEAGYVDTYLYWHTNYDTDPAQIWFRTMIETSIASLQRV